MMKGYSDDELLTREETAEMLGVNVTTLWRWAKGKSLPCVYVGRL
ncbi:MAG: helix-turn-helix domain-containing protein [Prevotellaceae bacterium]|nr:helix-turn-helix domain-containing protein [Candidatus Colivivens equi]